MRVAGGPGLSTKATPAHCSAGRILVLKLHRPLLGRQGCRHQLEDVAGTQEVLSLFPYLTDSHNTLVTPSFTDVKIGF